MGINDSTYAMWWLGGLNKLIFIKPSEWHIVPALQMLAVATGLAKRVSSGFSVPSYGKTRGTFWPTNYNRKILGIYRQFSCKISINERIGKVGRLLFILAPLDIFPGQFFASWFSCLKCCKCL